MNANVRWDGKYWSAVVDADVPVVTQSKRLDQLPRMLAEVYELMTDRVIDPDDIVLNVQIEHSDVAAQLRDRRAAVAAELAATEQLTADVIRELRAEGLSMRDIGFLVGVSHQRVHQLIA